MDFAASAFDIKSLDESGSIEGLLAGFGNADRGDDVLLAGCLTKSLAARTTPLPMLLYHDLTRPVGAWRSWQDKADGLYVKGTMTLSARDGQEAYALAKDGALTGLSIGWRPQKTAYDQRGKRVVTEAELYEGSLVAVPMNERTQVTSIKSIDGARDIEDLLREGGLSGRQAKAAASAAWKSINTKSNDDDASAELAAILTASAKRLGFN